MIHINMGDYVEPVNPYIPPNDTPALGDPTSCRNCLATQWEYDRDPCSRAVCPMRPSSPVAVPPAATLDLDAIMARADAATAGPWWIDDSNQAWVLQGVGAVLPPAMDGWPEQILNHQILKAPKSGTPYAEYWPDEATAAFIVHSRQDVPALVAEVEKLRTKLEQANITIRAFVEPSSHTDADDIEQYRSYKAPGVDCPECFVDTGDSEHVVGCSIGAALGCATRPPMRDGILLRCHCGSELMVSGKAHGSALLHHADGSHTVMGPLALGPILGGLDD